MTIADTEVTAQELSALTGYTDRHIRRFAEAGVIEKTGRNRYRLGQAVPALFEELSKGGDAGAELTKERVRKTRAEATMAELELAKATGEVCSIREAEDAMDMLIGLVRTNMLQIPTRVASMLIGETSESKFKDVLRQEIIQVLTDAAEAPLNINEFEENDENA